jgi:hypothetical protein
MTLRTLRFVLPALLVFLPAREAAHADGAPAREYQLKAAFIYNFAQFVEWPGNTFSGPDEPLVIGVMGNATLAATLEQACRGKTAGRREIVVKSLSATEAITSTQILFIGAAERDRLPELLKRATAESVLTIGDYDGFTAASGMVRFLTEDNRLRFEVNLQAVNEGRLKFSAQLLKLARMYNK